MLVYRVFPYLPAARDGEQGHPAYLPLSTAGRFDNPDHYGLWYLALEPVGAVGESFADLPFWRDDMFLFPRLPGSRRALAVFELPDDTALLDFDEPSNLVELGVRPSQVIGLDRPATQAMALKIHGERSADGGRRWAGVRWWSSRRPQWTVMGYWRSEPPRLHDVEELGLDHPAVAEAAQTLLRQRR